MNTEIFNYSRLRPGSNSEGFCDLAELFHLRAYLGFLDYDNRMNSSLRPRFVSRVILREIGKGFELGRGYRLSKFYKNRTMHVLDGVATPQLMSRKANDPSSSVLRVRNGMFPDTQYLENLNIDLNAVENRLIAGAMQTIGTDSFPELFEWVVGELIERYPLTG